MALPERIGGPKSEEKKPGLVIAIGTAKKGLPPRIGGPKDEAEGPAESMSNEQALDEASKEIMAAIDKRSDLQLKSALRAFFYACDAEPHDEGEHNEEEAEEGI
jgi:hypothetical protein